MKRTGKQSGFSFKGTYLNLDSGFEAVLHHLKLATGSYEVEGREVAFHAYQWRINLLSISRFVRSGRGPYSAIEASVNRLLAQMKRHVVVQDRAMFIPYPFNSKVTGELREIMRLSQIA